MSKLFDALRKATAQGNAKDIRAIFGDSALPATPLGLAPTAPAAKPASESSAAVAYRSVKLHMQSGIPALPFDGTAPRAAEQYRMIRTRIVHDQRRPRICLVSSPTAGDGKTITTINIAASLALKSGVSVLLIDCDLRRAGIAKILGIDSAPGLAGVLEGSCALRDAIVRPEELPGLHVLPAGELPANPTELLDSAAWRTLCATVKRDFHHVILDSCPVGAVADYELLQDSADGVIIVVRPDHTNRALSMRAVGSVPKEKMLGIVVNCAREWFLKRAPAAYYHYADYR